MISTVVNNTFPEIWFWARLGVWGWAKILKRKLWIFGGTVADKKNVAFSSLKSHTLHSGNPIKHQKQIQQAYAEKYSWKKLFGEDAAHVLSESESSNSEGMWMDSGRCCCRHGSDCEDNSADWEAIKGTASWERSGTSEERRIWA